MRRTIITLLVCSLLLFIHGQTQVFRAKLVGMRVQTYNPQVEIDSLTVYQSGEWVFMRAWSNAGFGDILSTKLKEAMLQGAKPPVGYITGLNAISPGDGYVYLRAVSAGGFTADIIRTKWSETGAQTFTAPAGFCISGFTASGPDAEGYVYLAVLTGQIGIAEQEQDLEKSIERFSFELGEISPNPFVDYTRIFYSLASKSPVQLRIYDNTGRLVKTLVNTTQPPGRYNLSWAGIDEAGRLVSSGTYFVKLEAGEFSATKKLLIAR